MSRKGIIARRFSESLLTYDANAALQETVAARLAGLLPDASEPRILEIGCGTGLFSRRLIARYPRGRFLFTDIGPDMVSRCRENIAAESKRGAETMFAAMDGDCPAVATGFDLVASSMTLQWCDDPRRSLESWRRLLKPGGRVVFATIGPGNFPEWRETLASLGEPVGLLDMPALDGVVREESITAEYGDAAGFIRALRDTGARQPRPGYRPLSATALRRALAAFDRRHGGCVTWRLVYGVLDAPGAAK
ncbi:methyltransferase domain-containing protein [Rhodomicrobium sp. Az07]|uniref:methyltransferase n=1 Tax=Rhodomicrobium sp. Az07 TaxID=2839034 RepID=UPI001BE82582|nr:methyltransferase [Rhodomicrobium sp. Az07]MBT3071558.1 methyltransferase domain-containing protein [Rhodomicrobium sp. Az07]